MSLAIHENTSVMDKIVIKLTVEIVTIRTAKITKVYGTPIKMNISLNCAFSDYSRFGKCVCVCL